MKFRHGHGLWLHVSQWEGYKNWRDYGAVFTPKNIIKTDGQPPEGDTYQEEHFPLVPKYRVKGHTYQPYNLNTDWARAANKIMSGLARSNFSNLVERLSYPIVQLP